MTLALGPLISPPDSKNAIRPEFDASKYRTRTTDTESTFVWGKPGASPFQLTGANNVIIKDDNTFETKRTFDVVRVKDPDNADNHVDMEVVTSLQLKNKIDGKRTQINMDRVTQSDTVQILQQDQTRVTPEKQ